MRASICSGLMGQLGECSTVQQTRHSCWSTTLESLSVEEWDLFQQRNTPYVRPFHLAPYGSEWLATWGKATISCQTLETPMSSYSNTAFLSDYTIWHLTSKQLSTDHGTGSSECVTGLALWPLQQSWLPSHEAIEPLKRVKGTHMLKWAQGGSVSWMNQSYIAATSSSKLLSSPQDLTTICCCHTVLLLWQEIHLQRLIFCRTLRVHA